MQPLEDGGPPIAESVPSLPMAASTTRLPKQRHSLAVSSSSDSHHPLAQSDISLPYRGLERRSNPSAASLFASTLTPPGSRSASPAPSVGARFASPSRTLSGSVFGGAGGFNKASLLDTGAADNPGDPLNLILKSFVPHIAVHGSPDVDDMIREKGFSGGLWELLRPFGERVQGKVTIRDSNGGARSWEDFSVRFTRFGAGIEDPEPLSGSMRTPSPATSTSNGSQGGSYFGGPQTRPSLITQVEAVVNRHLSYAEDAYMGLTRPATPTRQGLDTDAASPYYALYLRRLLSGIPLATHESFAHPVASVIAISSRNPSPIDALRKLYLETSQGERRLPVWVDGDFLRYYVLIHDEEQSDITKSMALFDQMKRNFGLHCHLLRIRSSQSAETDDDSIPLPRSDWMTPAEELADIERSESEEEEDFEDPTRYIFESDATAIRTFIREMVTQSVVPTMERNVSVWNDQVASRRRGISGRIMSLSKRWTTFGVGGSSSSRSSSTPAGGASANNNYDALGFYRPDTSEAIMRKLADYAFMLRDWKLAMSTYDLLRGDFQNDKAWKYHAAASEMAALSLLIMPQSMSSKNRLENITQMLDQAFYSYHTRCNSAYGVVRCVILAVELLRLRGGSGNIDEAVRWGTRLLESRLMGQVGDALLKERMAICYASKQGAGSQAWGSRRRKSALWSVLGAEAWISQHKYIQAQRCLNEARKMYSLLPGEQGVQNFAQASDFMAYLNDQVKEGLRVNYSRRLDMSGVGGGEEEEEDEEEDDDRTIMGGSLTQRDEFQQQQQMDDEESVETVDQTQKKSRRTSLIINTGTGGGGGMGGMETAPLTPLMPAKLPSVEDNEDYITSKDGFG
ncbi:ER-golgi trafficking TRAPP I complex 85 kDa subunit-domain-containing protein [Diplogelasinospora grovesii]|uniref:ER-golgi trafficking TRAPP I complex 85 kDa subunit-domain-containing protein n=1 Tax=Diplogelasinospora grovesii TaxID=303347 RepID=A0AAN6S515_9PEZI|nr:ER-golgi trafficking TRAPP I complex 85 kDa subunit-domain-containing protein [Diplogelasinospora grovesii]